MASTETQALKIIWENKGKAPISKIAKELRISTDYARLICGSLVRNKIIEFFEGQYQITDLGRKELKRVGMIEKVKKVIRPKGKARVKIKKEKKGILKTPITKLSNLSPDLIKALEKKGIRTLEDVATISISRIMEATEDLTLYKAAHMINEARDKLRKEGKEYLWE